ncbi:hypothetical protein V2J94_05325 [Streptomyces sp. DSM 41524]|uniref:Oxaloacetate decarboxylase n=1 Tax=Streptomyces asiaticus subsp. ignotus TaxID=3098222 RepID=A0ABU7PQF2_9ACTN|nr:hypothetical protein [Streptomyces sp. DSM 41524]
MAEPALIGGEIVRPGDVVRADADGVVVVRREDLKEVIAKSRARVDAEDAYTFPKGSWLYSFSKGSWFASSFSTRA